MILFWTTKKKNAEFVEPDWLDHLVGYLLQNNVVGVAPRLSQVQKVLPNPESALPLILGIKEILQLIAEEGSKLLSLATLGIYRST